MEKNNCKTNDFIINKGIAIKAVIGNSKREKDIYDTAVKFLFQ